MLHRALEQAVRFNLIPFNPASRVDPPKIRQDEITPLDAEQARRFLDAARGRQVRGVSTSCPSPWGFGWERRWGLRWSDIDLDAKTLRVNRQLQRMRDGVADAGILRAEERHQAHPRPPSEGRRSSQKPPQAADRGAA